MAASFEVTTRTPVPEVVARQVFLEPSLDDIGVADVAAGVAQFITAEQKVEARSPASLRDRSLPRSAHDAVTICPSSSDLSLRGVFRQPGTGEFCKPLLKAWSSPCPQFSPNG